MFPEFPLLSPPAIFNIKNSSEDNNLNKKNQVRFEDETRENEVEEDNINNREKLKNDKRGKMNDDEKCENTNVSNDRYDGKNGQNNLNMRNDSNNNGENEIMSDLKDEIGRLRYIVHKLNSQLLTYQNEYGALSYDEVCLQK